MSAAQAAPAPRISDGEDELLAAMERANDWLSPEERLELERSHLSTINSLFRLANKRVADRDAEIASLNARLATARRDALLEAAETMKTFGDNCVRGAEAEAYKHAARVFSAAAAAEKMKGA